GRFPRRRAAVLAYIDLDGAALAQAALLVRTNERIAATSGARSGGGFLFLALALIAQALLLLRAGERVAPAAYCGVGGIVGTRRPFALARLLRKGRNGNERGGNRGIQRVHSCLSCKRCSAGQSERRWIFLAGRSKTSVPMRPLALIAVAAAMCSACAAEPLAPVAAPTRASFDPALIAKGAQLAAIGNCQVCHTAEGGKSFAGGRPIETPFGTFYGTNITPDPDTGIGGWSEPAFVRALREGLDRDGRHLYPAFPYEYYTRLTDEDIHALYAYIATREPVRAQNMPHELRAPFNIRALVATWKALYFER